MSNSASRYAVEGGIIVSHAERSMPWFARMARDLVLLAAPAIAVTLTLYIAWVMRGTPFTLFDGVLTPPRHPELYPSRWLGIGHAIVPVIFLIANLVNRRLGEDYAIAHVFLSWSLALAAALAVLFQAHPLLPPAGAVPGLRVAGSFLGAMVIGQLAGVYVFDRTRGVVWWKAPVYSALTTSFVAMFLFYPAAYAGENTPWLHQMSIDAGVKALMSFAMLIPYLLLRPIVRPSAGLGGF
jgi:uncharacterized PurR-regulated membrane protein YhhQ (DUF165 family)